MEQLVTEQLVGEHQTDRNGTRSLACAFTLVPGCQNCTLESTLNNKLASHQLFIAVACSASTLVPLNTR